MKIQNNVMQAREFAFFFNFLFIIFFYINLFILLFEFCIPHICLFSIDLRLWENQLCMIVLLSTNWMVLFKSSIPFDFMCSIFHCTRQEDYEIAWFLFSFIILKWSNGNTYVYVTWKYRLKTQWQCLWFFSLGFFIENDKIS